MVCDGWDSINYCIICNVKMIHMLSNIWFVHMYVLVSLLIYTIILIHTILIHVNVFTWNDVLVSLTMIYPGYNPDTFVQHNCVSN